MLLCSSIVTGCMVRVANIRAVSVCCPDIFHTCLNTGSDVIDLTPAVNLTMHQQRIHRSEAAAATPTKRQRRTPRPPAGPAEPSAESQPSLAYGCLACATRLESLALLLQHKLTVGSVRLESLALLLQHKLTVVSVRRAPPSEETAELTTGCCFTSLASGRRIFCLLTPPCVTRAALDLIYWTQTEPTQIRWLWLQ